MRHMKSGKKFNRNSSHRVAMFRNMASSLFTHELIRTTLPKAKELRRIAEPLITMAKGDSIAKRRLAFARLRDREAVTKLFNDLGPRYKERPGGYLRLLKCANRTGDNRQHDCHLVATDHLPVLEQARVVALQSWSGDFNRLRLLERIPTLERSRCGSILIRLQIVH